MQRRHQHPLEAITPSERDACGSQPPDLTDGIIVHSEQILAYEPISEVADDLVIEADGEITHARWWGSFYCDPPPYGGVVESLNLRLYLDRDCLPDSLVLEVFVPINCNETLVQTGNFRIYEYDTSISFPVTAGQRYWFSAQAGNHRFPPRYGRLSTESLIGCQAAFRSAFFGYSEWVPIARVRTRRQAPRAIRRRRRSPAPGTRAGPLRGRSMVIEAQRHAR